MKIGTLLEIWHLSPCSGCGAFCPLFRSNVFRRFRNIVTFILDNNSTKLGWCSIISKQFELSVLEREIISSLRFLGKGTARKIQDTITSNKHTDVPYTTLSSALKRLHSNNLVDRKTEKFRGKERKRYMYIYKDFEAEYIDNLVGGLLSTFGKSSVVHLAESLTKTDIAESDLEKIRAHLKEGD